MVSDNFSKFQIAIWTDFYNILGLKLPSLAKKIKKIHSDNMQIYEITYTVAGYS